ncbi:hypothetical protein ES703_46833 [subsurface metagenome]
MIVTPSPTIAVFGFLLARVDMFRHGLVSLDLFDYFFNVLETLIIQFSDRRGY